MRVNRSLPPPLPSWADKFVFPETERPEEYDFCKIEFLQTKHQHGYGFTWGKKILGKITKNNWQGLCLDLNDGLAIQEKGVTFFKSFFGKEIYGRTPRIFLWGSLVKEKEKMRRNWEKQIKDLKNLYVPYLSLRDNSVVLSWRHVNNQRCDLWYSSDPALMLPKP